MQPDTISLENRFGNLQDHDCADEAPDNKIKELNTVLAERPTARTSRWPRGSLNSGVPHHGSSTKRRSKQ